MEKPILYILCGLPFSGKTVLVKQIADALNYEVVNIDEIKFANGFQWIDDDSMAANDWKKIFDESYDKTFQYLNENKTVLYDCANQDRAAREELRKVAARGDFPTKVIWLDIPMDIIKERYSKNKESKERFDIPQRLFQAAIDTYEPPTKDENVIRFTGTVPFSLWVKQNFR